MSEISQILVGDCLNLLPTLAAQSVQMVVTSPPYYSLRDYGVDGQIGLEDSVEDYLHRMLTVFRSVWRVLRDDGTLWLNLGDSYMSGGRKSRAPDQLNFGRCTALRPPTPNGLKPKDLIGIPWRLAFALQAEGWFLRSDIVWSKPNPMPECVTDRPCRSHDYVFLLTKCRHYYYDAEAIREPVSGGAHSRGHGVNPKARTLPTAWDSGPGGRISKRGRHRPQPRQNPSFSCAVAGILPSGLRNRRTVWTIAPQPFAGAHFATFPEALVEPCVLAGSRPGDFVLDPFAGSGTTLRVAVAHGRRAIGIELNPEYVALARNRIDGLQMRLPLAGEQVSA